jgi:HNH endonuclease
MGKPRFKASVAGGMLFKVEARVDFLTITGRKYDDMRKRPAVEKAGGLPFTKEDFRQDVLGVLGGQKDGAAECRYCHGFFVVSELAADHAVPLSRQGELGLGNIDYPCINCNRAKGSMTPAEFSKLIEFLERELPLARRDILGRLSKAISLAVAARRAHSRMRAMEQGETIGGAPRPALQARLGEFKAPAPRHSAQPDLGPF